MPETDPYWQRLQGWRPASAARAKAFSGPELEHLDLVRPAPTSGSKTIAYCVYENPFAMGGGVYQVAWNLALALESQGHQVVLLSPLHSALATAPDPRHLIRLQQIDVPFDHEQVAAELVEPDWAKILSPAPGQALPPPVHARVRWVLVDAPGFFEADGGHDGKSPYDHGGSGAEERGLLLNSLFFCAAVPQALSALDLTRNVLVHAQDWELAATAITVKEALLPPPGGQPPLLESGAVILTSHNPYDRYLPHSKLRLITERSWPGETICQRMIPLTDAPVSTVSRTFARELTHDPLQAGVFAGHLQDTLQDQGIVGVDNGLFLQGSAPFSDEAVESARNGRPGEILEQKQARRLEMLRLLDDYRPAGVMGHLTGEPGCPAGTLGDDVPVFMMSGRLDPGQKGFDLLARAVDLLPRGACRVVLCPSQANPGDPFLDDLEQLTLTRPGEVVVYPMRMERGFFEFMAGATYTVWPSLYEPFGGATESYIKGTPLVSRATGGLAQQVVDADADPARGTGFLFAEDPTIPAAEDRLEYLSRGWRQIQERRTPGSRQEVPLYWHLAGALAVALTRAALAFRCQPTLYGAMLSNLDAASKGFSWDRAVTEYSLLYAAACRGT